MPSYDNVFSTNPGAILGRSWGHAAAKLKMNEANTKNSEAPPTAASKAVTFLNSINESDDDSYAPISMTSWGSQQRQQQELTNDQQTIQDWNSLVDPNFTVKAGGIGSGMLHRQGPNYKPMSEAMILNQRLSKPMPGISTSSSKSKVALDGSVKKKSKKRKKRERVISMPVHALPEMTVNGWGSGQLTSTPFWEQQQQEQQQQQQQIQECYTEQYPQQQQSLNTCIDHEGDVETIPSIKVEIDLAPGVSISVTIFKGDTMISLVEDICRHHHLSMTLEAKQALSSTFDLFIQTKYP